MCTDSFIGKNLNENGVRHSSVDDNGLVDAASDCLYTAVYLRYHAARDDALHFQERHLADVYLGDKCGRVVLIVEKSCDISHKDKVLCAKLSSYSCSSRIGVDIVSIALLVGGNCSDNGDIAVC